VSLILDALRKADAERERGSVPRLHSQPVVAAAGTAPRETARPNWLWITIGVAVGLIAAALWVMIGRSASGPSTGSANPAPVPPGSLVANPAAPVATNVPPPAATLTAPQTVAEPAPWPQPDQRKSQRADLKEAKDNRQVVTLGNVPPAGALVHSREQLPPDIRAALPQFAIGGSVYSADPTARSLIINGQLYREKDRLTQELSLDEIKLKAAIFSFRGYRFEVVF
jgi:general secretion pathway protein B